MELTHMVRVTSKGQVTIPLAIRKALKIDRGSTLFFKLTNKEVALSPYRTVEEPAFAEDEWEKIERIAFQKGTICKTVHSARKHLRSL